MGNEKVIRLCPVCRVKLPVGVDLCPHCGDVQEKSAETDTILTRNTRKLSSIVIALVFVGVFIGISLRLYPLLLPKKPMKQVGWLAPFHMVASYYYARTNCSNSYLACNHPKVLISPHKNILLIKDPKFDVIFKKLHDSDGKGSDVVKSERIVVVAIDDDYKIISSSNERYLIRKDPGDRVNPVSYLDFSTSSHWSKPEWCPPNKSHPRGSYCWSVEGRSEYLPLPESRTIWQGIHWGWVLPYSRNLALLPDGKKAKFVPLYGVKPIENKGLNKDAPRFMQMGWIRKGESFAVDDGEQINVFELSVNRSKSIVTEEANDI